MILYLTPLVIYVLDDHQLELYSAEEKEENILAYLELVWRHQVSANQNNTFRNSESIVHLQDRISLVPFQSYILYLYSWVIIFPRTIRKNAQFTYWNRTKTVLLFLSVTDLPLRLDHWGIFPWSRLPSKFLETDDGHVTKKPVTNI